jgi:hypothetical protein
MFAPYLGFLRSTLHKLLFIAVEIKLERQLWREVGVVVDGGFCIFLNKPF